MRNYNNSPQGARKSNFNGEYDNIKIITKDGKKLGIRNNKEINLQDRSETIYDCKMTKAEAFKITRDVESLKHVQAENSELKHLVAAQRAQIAENLSIISEVQHNKTLLRSLTQTIEAMCASSDSDPKAPPAANVAAKIVEQERRILELTELNAGITRDRDEITNNFYSLNRTNTELNRQVEMTSQTLEKTLSENRRLQDTLREKQKELNSKKEATNRQIVTLSNNSRRLETELTDARSSVKNSQDVIQRYDKQIKSLEETVSTLKTQFTSLEERVNLSPEMVENTVLSLVVKTFRDVSEELNTDCPVCFGTFGNAHKPCSLSCGHVICDKCGPAFKDKDCPVCRHKMVSISEPCYEYAKFTEFYAKLANVIK
jgi:predicted  nucleic acid-binding Zn-ribbon protein